MFLQLCWESLKPSFPLALVLQLEPPILITLLLRFPKSILAIQPQQLEPPKQPLQLMLVFPQLPPMLVQVFPQPPLKLPVLKTTLVFPEQLLVLLPLKLTQVFPQQLKELIPKITLAYLVVPLKPQSKPTPFYPPPQLLPTLVSFPPLKLRLCLILVHIHLINPQMLTQLGLASQSFISQQ